MTSSEAQIGPKSPPRSARDATSTTTRLALLGIALGALLAFAAPAQARIGHRRHPKRSATASHAGVAPKFAAHCEAIEARYVAEKIAAAKAATEADTGQIFIAEVEAETAEEIARTKRTGAAEIADTEAATAERVAELKADHVGANFIAEVEAEASSRIAATKANNSEQIAMLEVKEAEKIAAIKVEAADRAAEWSIDGQEGEVLKEAQQSAMEVAENCWEDARDRTEEAAEARDNREHQREVRHLPLLGKQEALRAGAAALQQRYLSAWSHNRKKKIAVYHRISRTRVYLSFYFDQYVEYNLATPTTWGHVTVWRSGKHQVSSRVVEEGYVYQRP